MAESIPLQTKAAVSPAKGALRVVLLYAGFSGLWILLSDRAVEALFRDPAIMTRVSILKGWVFVAVTAGLLFLMVKRLVEGVASREAKLQTLMNAIPDLVWLKNSEGVYLGCNRAFESFFGAPEAQILGRTDYDFVPKELADFFRQKDLEAIASGGARENEEWITIAETGKKILLETLKVPMRDPDGALVGVLGIGRDVTENRRLLAEQVRLEDQLHQAQKMELVGRFAGGVAHDYNNMLGVILANADLAMYHMPLEQPERKRLEEIVRAARHSADLTRQLLAFARQQPVDPRLANLNEEVASLIGVLGRLVGAEIHLEWTPAPTLWKVRVDATQFGQVLTNLVVNARDASPDGGRIQLGTTNCTLTEADCADLPDLRPGDHVCLSVQDAGRGIRPELLSRIFEPFFTTKPLGGGTGLGLALVHGVVRQNHGAIRVDSTVGEGTCFQIYLPRA